jgi:hypothetical protein
VRRKPLRAAPLLALGFALLSSLGEVAASGSAGGDIERAITRFDTAVSPAYRAYRTLEAGLTESDTKRGSLEAWTEFTPGRGMTFDVVQESGSDYVRNKILRDLLEKEQALIARGLPLRAPLEAKNYVFEDGGASRDGFQRVILKAARKSDGIVNGSLFLHPEGGYISRIEGRLVKSPSFWVRDVDVVWQYARIGGHVVPVEMTSTARVRMFGRSNFRMTYRYVSIDGQRTGDQRLADKR